MNDKEIIVHQARRIAELEIELRKLEAINTQLCDLMGKRGEDTMLVYLSPEEANLIDLYRRATPEGKAMILATAERVAAESIERRKLAQELAQGHVAVKKARATTRKKLVVNMPAQDLSALPAEFFSKTTKE